MDGVINRLLLKQDGRAEILAYSMREKFATLVKGTWGNYEFLHGCLWALFCMELIDGDSFESACEEAICKVLNVRGRNDGSRV